ERALPHARRGLRGSLSLTWVENLDDKMLRCRHALPWLNAGLHLARYAIRLPEGFRDFLHFLASLRYSFHLSSQTFQYGAKRSPHHPGSGTRSQSGQAWLRRTAG